MTTTLNFDWGFRLGYTLARQNDRHLRIVFNDRIAGFAVELYRHAVSDDRAGIDATLTRAHAACTGQEVGKASFLARQMMNFRWHGKLQTETTADTSLDYGLGCVMGYAVAQLDPNGTIKDQIDYQEAGLIAVVWACYTGGPKDEALPLLERIGTHCGAEMKMIVATIVHQMLVDSGAHRAARQATAA